MFGYHNQALGFICSQRFEIIWHSKIWLWTYLAESQWAH